MTQIRLNTIVSTLLIISLILVSGCATPETSEPKVSDHLEARTGHSLGTQTQPGIFTLPPGISLDAPLSDEEAVAIALWNNAAFQELLSELGLARADLVKAGEIANPTFMALFPVGPKQLEFAARFPLESIWLRPDRMEVADRTVQGVAERMVQGGLDLVRDIKLACADLRLAKAMASTKSEAATILQDMSVLADSRFNAGDISEFEVVNARIDALNAEQEWQLSKAEINVLQARLHSLMGLGQNAVDFQLSESPSHPPRTIERGIAELLEDALANRPDLRAAELALEAAGQQVDLTEGEIYTLTAILDANDTDDDFEVGPGIDITIPIFNQNDGNQAMADAKLQQAIRRYITIRHQIALEVTQSYARWQQAVDAASSWNKQLIPELESAARLAQNGVDNGDLLPIQSLEARYQLNSALLQQRTALASWQHAVAELEHAIGHRLDLHPIRRETSSYYKP